VDLYGVRLTGHLGRVDDRLIRTHGAKRLDRRVLCTHNERVVAKDGRFYLRLTPQERVMFDAIAAELGFADTSSALRYLMREKHRELFGGEKSEPKRKRKR